MMAMVLRSETYTTYYLVSFERLWSSMELQVFAQNQLHSGWKGILKYFSKLYAYGLRVEFCE